MNINKPLIAATIFSFFFASSFLCHSLDSEINRSTLRGLQGVRVLVEELPQRIEREGLRKEELQKDVELKLRKAGIKVLTQEECLNTPGEPYLYINININTIKDEGAIYPHSIDIALIQNVTLQRNPKVGSYAITWSTGGVGMITKQTLPKLRESLGELLDIFIQAYRAMNPK